MGGRCANVVVAQFETLGDVVFLIVVEQCRRTLGVAGAGLDLDY